VWCVGSCEWRARERDAHLERARARARASEREKERVRGVASTLMSYVRGFTHAPGCVRACTSVHERGLVYTLATH
jgi:hypothetical protein